MALVLFWVAITIVLVHLCSLLEATLYSVRISTLVDRRAARERGAARLLHIKKNQLDEAISAILILNTVASMVGATLAGAQVAKAFVRGFDGPCLAGIGDRPEDVGRALYRNALRFRGPRVLLPHPADGADDRRDQGGHSSAGPARTRQILPPRAYHRCPAGAAEGLDLPRGGADHRQPIYSREITLREVMTPASAVFALSAEQTVKDLLATPTADAFSQIPLFRGSAAMPWPRRAEP
jgi:hypothetical protein